MDYLKYWGPQNMKTRYIPVFTADFLALSPSSFPFASNYTISLFLHEISGFFKKRLKSEPSKHKQLWLQATNLAWLCLNLALRTLPSFLWSLAQAYYSINNVCTCEYTSTITKMSYIISKCHSTEPVSPRFNTAFIQCHSDTITLITIFYKIHFHYKNHYFNSWTFY